MKLVCNRKKDIYILYGGDYWFHELKKNKTLNWNEGFIRSIAGDKHRKELMFAGHTKIEPFCSSIGLLYRKAKAEDVLKLVAEQMRKELHAENISMKEQIIGMYTYKVLSYNLPDEELKVEARYKEYYSNEGNDVMRLVFWSMESYEDWRAAEDEGDIMLGYRTPSEPK